MGSDDHLTDREHRIGNQRRLSRRPLRLVARGIPRAWHWIVAWTGFRGAALTLFGLTFAGIGIGVLGYPFAPPELFYSHLPVWVRSGIWIGSAVVAIAGATFDRPHWQSYGFAALFIGPSERAISYVGALVLEEPSLRWVAGVAVYSLICGVLALLAAWPEPATVNYRGPQRKTR
jgi:hypothetical protein